MVGSPSSCRSVCPALGVWALHRAWAQKPSPTILIAPNSQLQRRLQRWLATVDSGLGIGVALIALAWWAAHERRQDLVLRSLGPQRGRGGIVLCHLMALAAFCVIFGLLEATPRRGKSLKVAFLRAVQSPLYVVAGLALVWSMPPRYRSGSAFNEYETLDIRCALLLATFHTTSHMGRRVGGAKILALFVARVVVIAEPARLAVDP